LRSPLGSTNATHAQSTTTKQSRQSKASTSSPKWIEDKVSVRVESVYLSASGNLVLAYTVTNKSGADINLEFTESPEFGLKPHEPTRVFLKLKEPPSYSQVTRRDHFIYLFSTLLPADLPVVFEIVVSVSGDDKSSWFSMESPEERLRRLLRKKLGNTDSIAIFVPDRSLKITFPAPSAPRK
jgi:hypothetical protein